MHSTKFSFAHKASGPLAATAPSPLSYTQLWDTMPTGVVPSGPRPAVKMGRTLEEPSEELVLGPRTPGPPGGQLSPLASSSSLHCQQPRLRPSSVTCQPSLSPPPGPLDSDPTPTDPSWAYEPILLSQSKVPLLRTSLGEAALVWKAEAVHLPPSLFTSSSLKLLPSPSQFLSL